MIIFINSLWVPCHVIVGLFEATNMARIAMATLHVKLIIILQFVGQNAYVKDEGGNLSTFAQTFNFVVNCAPLALAAP